MTETELRAAYDAALDKLKSLQGLFDAGRAVGNSEAYVSVAELIAAEKVKYDAWVEWTCFEPA
jgi:hypothetical protein